MLQPNRPCFLKKGSEAFCKFINHVAGLITPLLWLTMLMVSFLSIIDILSFYIEHKESMARIVGVICFACLKATIFTLTVNVTRKIKWVYGLAISVTIAYALLGLINGISFILYGFGITRQMISVLSETNPTEVKEFIKVIPSWVEAYLVSVQTVFGFGIMVLIYVLLKFIPRRITAIFICCVSFIGLGYIGFYFVQSKWGKVNHFATLRTMSCVINFNRNQTKIKRLMTNHRDLPFPETAFSSHRAKNVILVIGESASRGHHSLYEYNLPTTPHMDTISSGLYVFKNAMASSTLTSENIPRILTFMTDEPDQKEWYEYPSILQVMKVMGYTVGWISNQEKTGMFSNVSTVLSTDADVMDYVGAIDSEDHTVAKYDELILPSYEIFMSGQDTLRFACIHLMGSHMDFRYRYPSSHSRFDSDDEMRVGKRPWLDMAKAKIVAEYDNSISYTDSLLNEIVESIRHRPEPSVMIYLSDHGHTVYDRGDYYGRDDLSSEVPFFIYANKSYRQCNPEIVKRLEESLSNPFSTSETIQIILSISGGQYRAYNAISDPLSPSFKPRPRYFDGEVIDK